MESIQLKIKTHKELNATDSLYILRLLDDSEYLNLLGDKNCSFILLYKSKATQPDNNIDGILIFNNRTHQLLFVGVKSTERRKHYATLLITTLKSHIKDIVCIPNENPVLYYVLRKCGFMKITNDQEVVTLCYVGIRKYGESEEEKSVIINKLANSISL